LLARRSRALLLARLAGVNSHYNTHPGTLAGSASRDESGSHPPLFLSLRRWPTTDQ
jgi:hypothetical protein